MARFAQSLWKAGVKLGERFLAILILITAALTLAIFVWLISILKSTALAPKTVLEDDCASCHPEIHAAWHKGAHSIAQSKTALSQGSNCLACHKQIPDVANIGNSEESSFLDLWVGGGMPNNCLSCHVTGYDATTNTWKSDGITCEACHGIVPENHPDAVVSVDRGGGTCRVCHTDDRFNWGRWEESAHYQESMACVNCHNPHSTSLVMVGESEGSSSDQCRSCHKDLVTSSRHSTHAKIGVTCTDCHLGDPKGMDDFHQIPDHDFKPKIETCNDCHTDQMHSAGKAKGTSDPGSFSGAYAAAWNSAPTQVETHADRPPHSDKYIAIALVFGLIGGVVWRRSISIKVPGI